MASANPTSDLLLKLPSSPEAPWIDLLNRMRDARATLLRDSEGFDKAAAVLEHVGQACGKQALNGLGKYKPVLMALVSTRVPDHREHAERLFEVVREARNTAVHDGAWIRHHGERLVEPFLILETAILSKLTKVRDVMVVAPITAQTWQMLADVRRALLLNSFSYLPVLMYLIDEKVWHLIADHKLVSFPGRHPVDDRRAFANETVEVAVTKGLKLLRAPIISEDKTVECLRSEVLSRPRLVLPALGARPGWGTLNPGVSRTHGAAAPPQPRGLARPGTQGGTTGVGGSAAAAGMSEAKATKER